MRIRVVPMSAALLAVVAMLGVGLFVSFGPALSSGSAEPGSRQTRSSLSNYGASPIDSQDGQSAPADTAKTTPIAEVRERGMDSTDAPAIPLATTGPTAGPPASGSRKVVVDVSQFRQLLPRDAIAPVYDAQFMPAGSAFMNADDLVIGVEINGESKAYPVGPLNFREMVNDTVGGVPVLVTW